MVSLSALLAAFLALGACVPHVLAMWRSRSSAGQSPLGWLSACVLNLLLAYVNLVGLHAPLPGLASLLVFAVCVVALVLSLRFRPAPA